MKITIITVCYNSEKTIEDTLKSVLKQSYSNYEYIIVDGQSTDNTLKIIEKYRHLFGTKLKLISESDKGLYDAMNKGIKLATGDIVGIINSDDVLISKDVFKKIIDHYTAKTDILYADLIYVDSSLTNPIRDYISGENKNKYWCPAHPTMYIRKKVLLDCGLYNLKYPVAADFDLMVRLNIHNYHFTYLKDYLVLMRLGGASNGLKGYTECFKEVYQILRNNNVPLPLTKTIIRTLKVLRQHPNKKKREALKKYLIMYENEQK